MKRLVLAGLGIKTISHISYETVGCINNADLVLYLVNEPVMESWILENNKNCYSLESIYFSCERRIDSYERITEKIIESMSDHNNVCVVMYGHPSIFASPGLTAIKHLNKKGVITDVLPAISAEDCLFADLNIDPGECGCYSVEANDFLIYEKQYDSSSYLVLWQIASVGNFSSPKSQIKSKALEMIVTRLSEKYPLNHLAFIYEAALYPGMSPKIVPFSISSLAKQELSPLSTLFVPPAITQKPNLEVLSKLEG